MIKILHTSDWHLGHILYGYDRTKEQQSMLQQMQDIVKAQQPDVLMICGDVYHTAQPSAAVQTMFTDAIVAIHNACPQIVIIITAGNHDSGSRIEIFHTPWQEMQVYVVGNLRRENPDYHIIEIPDKGYILAIPYSNERNIPEGYFQQLLNLVAERNTQNLPVVMSCHTTISGCNYNGHDDATERTVGGIDAFDLQSLGQGYDYLALGHIHHPQYVRGGNKKVRYSGTPIPVSFDEACEHSVSLVTIEQHGADPEICTLAISNPFPLVTLPTDGFTDWEHAKEELQNFPNNIPAYIRLNVETETFMPPEATAEAEAITEGKACRFCHINARRPLQQQQTNTGLAVEELQTIHPIDIVHRYANDIGMALDDEMINIFNEVYQAARNDIP